MTAPEAVTPGVLTACRVCGATVRGPSRLIRDHLTGERFELVPCAGCGARFIGDAPSPAEIGRYYATAAGDEMHTRPGRAFSTLRDVRLRRDVRPLLSRLAPGARVVDLGAGDGSMARVLRTAGCRVVAVDLYDPSEWRHPDVPYRRMNLADGALSEEDLAVDGRPADAIVMRHVLEHLHEPRRSLATARVAGVGHALVIVPNAASWLARALGESWYYWDPPRHLTFFTAPALREIAGRAGFDVPVLETYGLDEVVVSLHRGLLLRGGRPRPVARATRPTGPLAGAASAASALLLRSVLRAVLSARPPDAAVRQDGARPR